MDGAAPKPPHGYDSWLDAALDLKASIYDGEDDEYLVTPHEGARLAKEELAALRAELARRERPADEHAELCELLAVDAEHSLLDQCRGLIRQNASVRDERDKARAAVRSAYNEGFSAADPYKAPEIRTAFWRTSDAAKDLDSLSAAEAP